MSPIALSLVTLNVTRSTFFRKSNAPKITNKRYNYLTYYEQYVILASINVTNGV